MLACSPGLLACLSERSKHGCRMEDEYTLIEESMAESHSGVRNIRNDNYVSLDEKKNRFSGCFFPERSGWNSLHSKINLIFLSHIYAHLINFLD